MMKLDFIPKTSLGFFPTPLVELPHLAKAISGDMDGPQIFMKRDDHTGLAFGGNKTRKLEYILADALAKGCDCIITAGAIQSNHCRQTAAAAAKLNLTCYLVLGGEKPEQVTGNLLLDQLLGSQIHWAGGNRKGEDIPKIFARLVALGKKPYIVPYGGSNEHGAMGFVEASRELVAQQNEHRFSHIIFASSSGGTHAGLIVGKHMYQQTYRVVGINIDKGETDKVPLQQYILALANKSAQLLDSSIAITEDDVHLNADYLGDGYGVLGEPEKEAITLTAQKEGILLDPVYTGRAMAGLINMIRTKQIHHKDKVLFWHTGGAPALFAYADKMLD